MTNVERLAEARKNKAVRDLGITFIKFDKPGVEVLGVYVSKTLIDSKQFPSTYYQYIFLTDDGPVKFHMGGAADTEYAELFEPGDLYRIKFLKDEDLDNTRRIKRYEVEHVPTMTDR